MGPSFFLLSSRRETCQDQGVTSLTTGFSLVDVATGPLATTPVLSSVLIPASVPGPSVPPGTYPLSAPFLYSASQMLCHTSTRLRREASLGLLRRSATRSTKSSTRKIV